MLSRFFQVLVRDVRYSLRQSRKNPGITVIAVVSLALGIGANTAIFSVVSAIMLGSLPYEDPERLVIIRTTPPEHPEQLANVSVPQYALFRDRSRTFETVGGTDSFWAVNLGAQTDGAPAERVTGHRFSATLFQTLGVQPQLGRFYTPEEDQFGARATVVLSHNLWQRRFAGDPKILGQNIVMDGEETTVVGVMPPQFGFLDEDAEFWIPFRFTPALLQGRVHWITSAARLKPGVSRQQAQAEAQSIYGEFARIYPDRDQGWSVHLQPLSEGRASWMNGPLLVLQGAVGFVLLIACANLAGLMLARASTRQREAAIRAALGQSRLSMIRQRLTESVLLSFAGGFLGLLLAWIGIRPLIAISPAWFPRLEAVSLDEKVFVFTAAISLVAGVLFGILPALHASKPNLVEMLKDSGHGTTSGARRQRLRAALVTAEVALAVVLLVGSGLMINSFIRLQQVELGSDPTGLLTFQVRLPITEYATEVGVENGFNMQDFSPAVPLFFDRVLERLQQAPGVLSATASNYPPLVGSGSSVFTVEGKDPPASERDANRAALYWVAPNYFATMKIPLLSGRDIGTGDSASSPWVIVINEAMARRFWPNENPVGKRITFDVLAEERPREVIGVVANAARVRGEFEPAPTIYALHSQQLLRHQGRFAEGRMQMTFVMRTAGDPMSLAPVARNAVAEVDRNQPIFNIQTVESYMGQQMETPRYYMTLLGIFGIIAIILAMVGIYGVMAYAVAQRTHEIGVRRALGAGTGNILWFVLRSGLIMVATGLVLGLAGALVLTRYIQSFLWGITATDPITLGVISLLVVLTAFFACAVPSLRAAKVDPLEALRQ